MSTNIASSLHLAPVEDKATLVDFEGGRLSSDGGLILLNDPDDQLGFTRHLAAVLRDRRDPRRVDFTLHDLLKQRVVQIAAGYEDANDATTLRDDPIFKLLLGRLPESGPPLASQPTLSRFENRVSRTELSRLARVFVEQFIASYARPPKLIVLDFDDTEDPAHGQQEQIRYDGYYGGYGFLVSGCVSYTQYKENSRLSRRLEKGLGKQFGHRPDVICHPRSHHRRLIAIFFPRALDPLA